MADVKVYGIPNCDTVKKARKWLDANNVSYEFHDYKKHGIDKSRLKAWSKDLGWDTLLNRRGTTWRKLDAADKANVTEASALELMAEHTSMIKRPVLEYDGGRLVGFDEESYKTALC